MYFATNSTFIFVFCFKCKKKTWKNREASACAMYTIPDYVIVEIFRESLNYNNPSRILWTTLMFKFSTSTKMCVRIRSLLCKKVYKKKHMDTVFSWDTQCYRAINVEMKIITKLSYKVNNTEFI